MAHEENSDYIIKYKLEDKNPTVNNYYSLNLNNIRNIQLKDEYNNDICNSNSWKTYK
jgi:hypothetical protein